MFYQKGVKRYVFGEEPDEAVIARARDEQLPVALDYLESLLPAEGFLFGELSVADISIASFFRTAAFVRYIIDAERWPRCAALVALVQALPVFQKLARFEDALLRLPLAEHRSALNSLGAPLCRDTYGTATPQHGFRRWS